MICPNCGAEAWRDHADIGVGIIYGPYGCSCGWSEDEEYNRLDKGIQYTEEGYMLDQFGGATPPGGYGYIKPSKKGE